MSHPSVLEFLSQRKSVPAKQLGDPGPDAAQLQRLLALALRVPDHAKLTPWRLILLRGDARLRFGEQLAQLHARKDPDLPKSKLEKDRNRYAHAPLVVGVVARVEPGHPKVPEQEQVLSAGCIAYNLLLGARAMGFGAQWLTGWAAYDGDAARLLGLAANERVIGFVHIGTPRLDPPERDRPSPGERVSDWQG